MAVIVVAVLFGYGHYYKGPAGIVDSGIAGLILGAAYLVSGRVLWTTILAHGFIDTFGVGALYLGSAPGLILGLATCVSWNLGLWAFSRRGAVR